VRHALEALARRRDGACRDDAVGDGAVPQIGDAGVGVEVAHRIGAEGEALAVALDLRVLPPLWSVERHFEV